MSGSSPLYVFWLYHYALRLVCYDPHFKAYFQRRKKNSPGKGSGQRALVAVCDKVLRIIFRILTDNERYCPDKDRIIRDFYLKQRKAA